MTIEANTGAFSWTPSEAQGGLTPSVTVTVTDDGTGTLFDSETFTITVNDTNSAPVITSGGGGATAALNAVENQTGAATLTVSDTDLPVDTLSYTIIGGADQALFTLDASGVLTFNSVPDHDAPIDANGDGIYEVQVQVSDGTANDTQLILITVTEIYVAPPEVPEPVDPVPVEPPVPTVDPDIVDPPEIVTDPETGPEEPPEPQALPETVVETSVGRAVADDEFTVGGVEPRTVQFSLPELADSDRNSGGTMSMHEQVMGLLNRSILQEIAAEALIDPVQILAERRDFHDALNEMHKDLIEENVYYDVAIRSGTALATGLSIGYIAWLAKGGLMTASLITALPIWKLFDPIPVLASMDESDKDGEKESESLTSILEERQDSGQTAANGERGVTDFPAESGDTAS
jgi:hypothetical protein